MLCTSHSLRATNGFVYKKNCEIIPWALTTKSPPSVWHETLQLENPAAAVTAPSGTSPAPAQPVPTQVPVGSATSQPSAAHAVASLDAHESPEYVGHGQRCA